MTATSQKQYVSVWPDVVFLSTVIALIVIAPLFYAVPEEAARAVADPHYCICKLPVGDALDCICTRDPKHGAYLVLAGDAR